MYTAPMAASSIGDEQVTPQTGGVCRG